MPATPQPQRTRRGHVLRVPRGARRAYLDFGDVHRQIVAERRAIIVQTALVLKKAGISYRRTAAAFDVLPSALVDWCARYQRGGVAALTPQPFGRHVTPRPFGPLTYNVKLLK